MVCEMNLSGSLSFQIILSQSNQRPIFSVDKISDSTESKFNQIRKFPGAPHFLQRGLKAQGGFLFLHRKKNEPEVITHINVLSAQIFPDLKLGTAKCRVQKIINFLRSTGYIKYRALGKGRFAFYDFEGMREFSNSRFISTNEHFISVPANLSEICYKDLPGENQKMILRECGLDGIDKDHLNSSQRGQVNAYLAKRIGDNELAVLNALDQMIFEKVASDATNQIRNGALTANPNAIAVSPVVFDSTEKRQANSRDPKQDQYQNSLEFLRQLRDLTGESSSQIWSSLKRLEWLGFIKIDRLLSANGVKRIGLNFVVFTNAAMSIFFGISFNLARLAGMLAKVKTLARKAVSAVSGSDYTGPKARSSAFPSFIAASSDMFFKAQPGFNLRP